MGSGSSKEKQPQPRKGDSVSKPNKPAKINDYPGGKQTTLDSRHDGMDSNPQKGRTDTSKIGGYNNDSNGNKVTHFSNRDPNNGHVQNSGDKNLGKFESDSDSEGEDINAVLEATKNEYNRSQQERNRQVNDTLYPETYAQRLQREQYRNEPKGLMRQKTIYRNPDEWEVEDNEVESFDVSKFKQANVQNKTSNDQNYQLNRDIFSPSVPDTQQKVNRTGYEDNNQSDLYERKKSLPHYDTSEEALLDEIEKEFEL